MDELRKNLDAAVSGLREFAKVQEQYDAVGWQISNPASFKLRHVVLHLAAAVGQLSSICEGQEHRERNQPESTGEEVRQALAEQRVHVATLLVSAAQLATLAGVDLGTLLESTYTENAKRFAPQSAFAQLAK